MYLRVFTIFVLDNVKYSILWVPFGIRGNKTPFYKSNTV